MSASAPTRSPPGARFLLTLCDVPLTLFLPDASAFVSGLDVDGLNKSKGEEGQPSPQVSSTRSPRCRPRPRSTILTEVPLVFGLFAPIILGSRSWRVANRRSKGSVRLSR